MGTVNTGVLLDERYRIIGRRAAGATATVWEAEDDFLRRRVALKILHDHLASDADLQSRFVDEARAAATVNHPALVAVYDSIVDEPGIVLEWIDGPDLRQRLDEGPIHHEVVADIGSVICGGLTALHAHGLVHRDVKPANILLTRDGQPKLTDFGIATSNAGDRTATGIVLGTAKYLAPEQVRGASVDGRTDVFALAAVLYEALAGQPPWARDGDLATALARLEADAPDLGRLRPEVPARLTATVMRGLAREPDDRWPSAAAFADALQDRSALPDPRARTATSRLPTPSRSSGASPDATIATRTPPDAARQRPVRPRRRVWPRLVGIGLALAIAALGAALLIGITDPDAPGTTTTADPIDVVGITAFDPEGSGPSGEHNELAPRAVDDDATTAWVTERYSSRDLGSKSGVGLVLTLDGVHELHEITIQTVDGAAWSVEVFVSTGATATDAAGIADFGAVAASGGDLGAQAILPLDAEGDTVVVWLTDLGAGPLPVQLAISDITIR